MSFSDIRVIKIQVKDLISVKKYIAVFCVIMISMLTISFTGVSAEDAPNVEAESAVLTDARSGNVLFEKNADTKLYPASTTKIMTALLTIEAVERGELSLDDVLTVPEGMFAELPPDGSKVGLQTDEEMDVNNLLKGLLIASGNDAALLLAERVGGSTEHFVEMMNARAAELGLKNTHFVNPHGLHDTEHYTTARDLAVIARQAMTHTAFRDIVDIAHIYLDATNLNPQRYFINTNNLVSRFRYLEYYYDKATGIKTGATTEAGNCLVSSAKDGEAELICVVLKGATVRVSHSDSKNLLQYGFRNFKNAQMAKKNDLLGEVSVKQSADGSDYVSLCAGADVSGMLPKTADLSKVEYRTEVPETVYAPVTAGQEIGCAVFTYEGAEVGRVALTAVKDIKRHPFGFLMSFGEWVWSFHALRIVVYILLGCLIGFIVLLIVGFVRAVRKSKRKKRRSRSYNPPPYYQKK